jgi:dienelactone hydrolase
MFHLSEPAAGGPAGSGRELIGWAWYPAEPASGASPAPYLPPGWEPLGQFWGFAPAEARSHAYQDVPVASDRDRFPVLVFSPAGFPPLTLAAILEEVASHGYVVIGVNHTGESPLTVFPDGRVVPLDAARMQAVFGPYSGPPDETMRGRAAIVEAKAADLQFVVEQLTAPAHQVEPLTAPGHRPWLLSDRLDLDRLGAFGHSLGGNAALEYARLDGRCKAVVNLDGGLWTSVGSVGLDRPTLQIMAEHPEMVMPCEDAVRLGIYPSTEWCTVEQGLAVDGWQTVYERSQPGSAVLIRGSGHISFLDVPFLPIAPGSMLAGGLVGVRIDAQRAWRLICDYLLAFFSRYLDGAPAPLLDGPSDARPEAVLGSPRALLAAPTGRPSTG